MVLDDPFGSDLFHFKTHNLTTTQTKILTINDCDIFTSTHLYQIVDNSFQFEHRPSDRLQNSNNNKFLHYILIGVPYFLTTMPIIIQ